MSAYYDADEAKVYEPYHGQAGWKPPYEHAQWKRAHAGHEHQYGWQPTRAQWEAAKYPRINWGVVIALGFIALCILGPVLSQ